MSCSSALAQQKANSSVSTQPLGEVFCDGNMIAIAPILLNRVSSDLSVRISGLLLSVFVLQSESVPNRTMSFLVLGRGEEVETITPGALEAQFLARLTSGYFARKAMREQAAEFGY